MDPDAYVSTSRRRIGNINSSNRGLVDASSSWLINDSMGAMSLCYVGEPPKRRHMIEESFGKSLRTSRGCLSFRGHQLGRDSPFLGSRQSVPASHAVIINEELRATKFDPSTRIAVVAVWRKFLE
ncbi:hypothetical protein KCU95_g33, partial [Aureobasidium melanogenum]